MLTKRKIKFALVLNGASVRNIEDLKANFDGIKVLDYYESGELQKWLEQRNYHQQKEALLSITSGDPKEIINNLYTIFQVPQNAGDDLEDIERLIAKKNKREIIEQYTSDSTVLNQLEVVAFSQEELEGILSKIMGRNNTVYLLGDSFQVKDTQKNIRYIGLNNPTVNLLSESGKFKPLENGITLENVSLSSNSPIRLVDKGINNCKIDEKKLKIRREFESLKEVFFFDSRKYNLGELSVESIHLYKNIVVLLGSDNEFFNKKNKIILFDIEKKKVIQTFLTYEYVQYLSTNRVKNVFYYSEVDSSINHDSKGYSYNLYKIDLDNGCERQKVKIGYLSPKSMWQISHIIPCGDKVYLYDTRENVNDSDNFAIGYQCHDLASGKLIKADEVEHHYVQKRGWWGFYTGRSYYMTDNFAYYFIHSDKALYINQSKKPLMHFNGHLGEFVVHNDILVATSCEIGNEGVARESEVEEGYLALYDIKSGKLLKKIKAYDRHIEGMHLYEDVLVTHSNADDFIKLWDIHTMEIIRTISYEEMESHYKGKGSVWTSLYTFDFDLFEDQFVVNIGNTFYIYE
ncbi:hypothetical protein [Fredinandcohnia quinoae]|uniref:Uncharacterized protein n=1 Tax=Fredinandcohnia quinoae TaxID=2918902 RepID=A0AAW5DW30_9BACI|nr:hypothetical protein [Fredinandcohnia sp. SECRCQ15]MCH1624223.1 hypothetical protein [Fredinandcohnia sp. SECRCQ15]